MGQHRTLDRRGFLKVGAAASAVGAAVATGAPKNVWAKSGTYATLIDLTRCDGCKGEPMPRCVQACRTAHSARFPEPKEPIKDLWPQKTHDDWSKRRDVVDTLTPYNWTTVQKVEIDGEPLFVPRRCMHCDNPPCANLCPFGALNKFEQGSVVINEDLCLGGAKCKSVCPWHIPQRQSGVGVYLKLQPMPAGGGVMYKCDLCHDRIRKGGSPACVEACEARLGGNRPLHFGPREAIQKMAQERAKAVGGFVYGDKENGGTATLYVSKVSFERIDAALSASKKGPHMQKVENPLHDVNRWAKGFLLGPIVAAVGAIGLALFQKGRGKGEE